MGLAGKLRELRWRAAGHYTRPLPPPFIEPLVGSRALEIGGPSAVFSRDGLLPVYPVCASVDNVQWSAETVWHGQAPAGDYAPDGEVRGRQHVLDSVDLTAIADAAYDVVFSSHVIEHIANPLRALAAWRRVTGDTGALLLVAPHKEGTFDHRRPVTPLEHMIEDFERGTAENDLTHLDETLRLHDRSRDAEDGDFEAWAGKRRDNFRWRVLHHHVFTTRSLIALLDHAGVQVLAAEVRAPHDIYVAGRFVERPDNARFLRPDAPELRASPFPGDRRAAVTPG